MYERGPRFKVSMKKRKGIDVGNSELLYPQLMVCAARADSTGVISACALSSCFVAGDESL